MSTPATGLVTGADGQPRCAWCGTAEDYVRYHDTEWGFPVTDDVRLFEKLCLEGFQSGLAWITILRKREGFREAFAGFDPERVARYGARDVTRLLGNAGIVRHRGKIEATIHNARAYLELKAAEGSLASFVWRYEPARAERPAVRTWETLRTMATTPASEAMSKELRKRGWKFVGPTTSYAFMQAMGLVNDHVDGCHVQRPADRARKALKRALLLVVALVGSLTFAPRTVHAQPQRATLPTADLVVRNAAVWTAEAARPRAEALAVQGDSIVAVGSNADIAARVGPRTRVIDARGRTIVPGFTDGHVHFLSGSLELSRANLEGAANTTEIRARLVAYRDAHPGTGWILGRGWNYAMFGAAALPTKALLDTLFPDRPVFLSAYDGHTSWVNSRALALAGITARTPNPANGTIVRDASGEATGALKEKASALVSRLVPAPTRSEQRDAVLAGMKLAASVGVTRVHSAGGDFELLPLLDSLARAQALTLRFDIGYFVQPPALRAEDVERMGAARARYRTDWVSGGLVKMMIDGVIESRTAAMLAPYSDDPSTSGALFWEPKAFGEAVQRIDAQGFRIMTHAIGEKGVRTVLDAYRNAAAVNGARARHHRVEHIETVTAADIPRFGKEGVWAGMQPLHAYPDANTTAVWSRNIGPERASRAWAWKRLSAGGAPLVFGSDWPVVSINPWPGVQVAVTRTTETGTPAGGFVPSEKLPVEQVLMAYTRHAAVAGGHERREGSLAPGKLADFVVLERDPFTAAPLSLATMRVDLTVVGGRVVHERAPR